MDYISHIPSPPLNSYIYDLYYINDPAPYRRLKILPMPTLHLEPIRITTKAQRHKGAKCDSQALKPSCLHVFVVVVRIGTT
jgi:hypothetical protein